MLFELKKMIIYTQGAFDILHVGHINLLSKCRAIAGNTGVVVVGVSGDDRYKSLKESGEI